MKKGKNIAGKRIARARKKAKITQLELSKRLEKSGVDLDRAAIAKIENQLRGAWDYEVVALAKALRVSVAWLLNVRE